MKVTHSSCRNGSVCAVADGARARLFGLVRANHRGRDGLGGLRADFKRGSKFVLPEGAPSSKFVLTSTARAAPTARKR